jgi:Tfp pilus tip-associated adhesin PilY1
MPDLIRDMTDDRVTAWPDGSPTLATAKVNGVFRSVLVMGEGNGGSSVFALDVTETVESDGTVVGPTLLWTFNDPNMGLTSSKPVVIRTRISGAETWLAVFSSGKGAAGDVGDSVYAVDVTTGVLVWRFDIGDNETYVSSDITAADEESGTPDGYISRLYFADNKGRLWKVDPSEPSGSVVIAQGAIQIDEGEEDPDPVTEYALFSTRQTEGALGEDRGVSGTLIAVPDATGRLVLYFGTGGTPETAVDAQNEFYAVYGDTGELARKMTPAPGVRFFGSATYNSGQIVFTRGEDVSSVDSCLTTSGEIVAIDAATFSEQFVLETNSTITAPMYAAGGEIFVLTLSGKVVASQYVGVRDSVVESSGGGGGGSQSVQDAYGEVPTPFVLLSWKQVY